MYVLGSGWKYCVSKRPVCAFRFVKVMQSKLGLIQRASDHPSLNLHNEPNRFCLSEKRIHLHLDGAKRVKFGKRKEEGEEAEQGEESKE